jgi:hypothetical protein
MAPTLEVVVVTLEVVAVPLPWASTACAARTTTVADMV